MAKISKHQLYVPLLTEVADVLQQGLQRKFEIADVHVVNCPNLREKPFMLAAEGLCGHPTLADVGGVPYLIPLAQENKKYNLKEIAKDMDIDDALIIGAGAGPRHHVGINCEMMANLKIGKSDINKTHVAKLGKDDKCLLENVKNSTEFCLLGNLFVSEGKPGQVIKVIAKKRMSSENFVTAMRKILHNHYKDKVVGIGGVFAIKSGKAKLHIMPDYSKIPLKTDADVNGWLKFYEGDAPLSCLSTFVTYDPGWDVRIEHTHCFSDHGQGGHYHEDTTPDLVEYEGYFNIADFMFRFDPPSVTHQVGRD